jgi:RNA polymerase sigma-70 factor (ECF subfamily)
LKFSTWLFSIANHHCIDQLRKRRMTQISIDDNPVLQNLEGNDPRPERHTLQQEARIEVQSMLDRLTPEYRTPLVLRYWEDLSYEEIAEAMQVTVATVKSRLFRARQQLAAIYQEQEPVTPPPLQRSPSPTRQPERSRERPTMLRMALAAL